MNYRKSAAILAICSISLSFFGCSVKEEQTETSDTSSAVIADESELTAVSESETETVSETADVNTNCKFDVYYVSGELKGITQYDDNGNEEITWFKRWEGNYVIDLYNTNYNYSNIIQRKTFQTDYSFDKFEYKDLHFLLDGIDTDSVTWEEIYPTNKNYISYKETEDAKGNIVSILGVIQKNDGGYYTEITKNIYDINDLLNRKTIITYGTSDDTEVKEYLYQYEFDDYGNLLRKDTFDVTDGVSMTLKEREDNEYNGNNDIVNKKIYEMNGDKLDLSEEYIYEYVYDDSGEISHKSRYNEHINGLVQYLYEYDYDEFHRLTYDKYLFTDSLSGKTSEVLVETYYYY